MTSSYGSFLRVVEWWAAVRRRAGLAVTVAALAGALMAMGAASGPAAAAGPLKLAVLGDSLTAGHGLPADAAFPARLKRALENKGIYIDVLNAGVSGDTASDARDRLDWSIPEGTDAVIVELGANDALRGLDPAVTRAALEDIIKRLKGRSIAVMLCGMYAPRNLGPDYAAKFDPIYPELARAYDLTLYPFFLDGVAGVRKLNQSDGMHPTAKGIDLIVEEILPTVETFINRVNAAPRKS